MISRKKVKTIGLSFFMLYGFFHQENMWCTSMHTKYCNAMTQYLLRNKVLNVHVIKNASSHDYCKNTTKQIDNKKHRSLFFS